MTGPEHYQAAERLMGDADHDLECGDQQDATNKYALAQVHATLALAAATALAGSFPHAPGAVGAWIRVAAT